MVEGGSIGDTTADNGRADVTHIEPADARCTLVLLVPHADDEDQTGRHAGLKHTEEEAKRVEAREGGADGVEHDKSAPEDDVDAEVLGDGKLLADVLGGEHPDEEAHVKGLRDVVVVDAVDGEVHDGCVGQDVLVQKLGEVDEDEKRHDA